MQTGAQSGTVISAEDTSELKSAIDAAAAARGAPLLWPSSAGSAKKSSGLFRREPRRARHARGTRPSPRGRGHAHRPGQQRTGDRRGALDVPVPGSQQRVLGRPGEGVNRAADLYAGIFAVSGTSAPVDIEVSRRRRSQGYATCSPISNRSTLISHVGVEALNGDTVRFRLTTRGGTETLQHALALNGRLQPVAAGENGILRFQLRR